jgi:hypothetical protein
LVAFGEEGHGTVVVPSDIAYPFKAGHTLAGPEAASFKWVPLLKANGELLTQQVFATTRKNPEDGLLRVVEVLRQEVADRQLNVGDEPTRQ